MTYALFSVAMSWILVAIWFGLKSADSSGRKAVLFCWLSSTSLRLAGAFALFTLISAFADAFGALK
jgi:hypothetical protein